MKVRIIRLMLILCLNVTSTNVFAIVGKSSMVDQSKKSSVCRLIQRDKMGIPSICTAFLIAPNLAMTAAHCIDQNTDWQKSPTYLECGNNHKLDANFSLEYSKKGTPIRTKGIEFDESLRIIVSLTDPQNDQAVLKLERSSHATPLTVIGFAFPSDIRKCWITGFGFNQRNYAGVIGTSVSSVPEVIEGAYVLASWLNSPTFLDHPHIDFAKDSLAWEKARRIIRNIKNEEITASFVSAGDSGGPLLCELKSGHIGVIGVTSRIDLIGRLGIKNGPDYDWLNRSYFTPINLNLIEKFR